MAEKVVITGTGTVNPLGNSVFSSWEAVLAGRSGIGPISLFDTELYEVKLAGEVREFDPALYLPHKELRRRDRSQHFSAAAAAQAIDQAGLDAGRVDPRRVGVIVSCSIGGMESLAAVFDSIFKTQPRRVSPLSSTMFMANGSSGMLAMDYGYKGPALSVNSACASGADGIGTAWMMIRSGMLDAAIAGGTEAPLNAATVASLDRSGAMSHKTPGDSPGPKPFDLERDGFIMGEGAGVLVLESESHARKRGAEILAELAGYGSTADAYHITAPAPDGEGACNAMELALTTAGANLDEVDYINAHGTGTVLNDKTETVAIKRLFGDRARNIPVSSTKSMTGHMVGATGALEAIFCVQALRDQVAPPTINYDVPDPDCDLDYIPNQARQTGLRTIVSNSFGFGGHNAVLVLRKFK